MVPNLRFLVGNQRLWFLTFQLLFWVNQPQNLAGTYELKKIGIKKSLFFKVLEKKGIAQENLVSRGLSVSLACVRLHCLILTLQDQASSF